MSSFQRQILDTSLCLVMLGSWNAPKAKMQFDLSYLRSFPSFFHDFLIENDTRQSNLIEKLFFILRMIVHIQQKTKAWIQTRVVLIRLCPLYMTPASEVMKRPLIKNTADIFSKIFITILYCFI